MKKRKIILNKLRCCSLILALSLFVSSCGGGGGGGGGSLSKENILISDGSQREWTFVVYMAADNDLEGDAMRNFNQLEAVQSLNSNKISIIVLIDRTPGYDSTDGDWTDTRLYEVKPDPEGINTKIVSKRLECSALELTEDGTKELDMSDYRILSSLVSFAKTKYQAKNYGLIMWGHGTGWRNRSSSRAFAIDDTTGSSSAMPVAQMRVALEGKGLSVIGFDTCFSAVLENIYELKNCASSIIGTPGLTPGSGWEYSSLFSSFVAGSMTQSRFEDCVINSYKAQYSTASGTAVSVIDTAKVENVFICLEDLSETLAGCITDMQSRNTALSFCMNASRGYGSSTFPSDWFLSIYDFSRDLSNYPEKFSSSSSEQVIIKTKADNLNAAVCNTVKKSWSADGNNKPLGVHFIPLTGFATPASRHSDAYMKGTSVLYKPQFVVDSKWWVPSTPVSQSFLDKLFYTSY